jgi:hypothetical protein
MSVWSAFAMRVGPHPGSAGLLPNPNPGSVGMTRSKAGRPGTGSTSGSMTYRNSATDPGHPCVSSSGMAPSRPDQARNTCNSTPSTGISTGSSALSRPSCCRQS